VPAATAVAPSVVGRQVPDAATETGGRGENVPDVDPDAAMASARETMDRAAAAASPAATPARPPEPASRPTFTSADIGRETRLNDAARMLASDLAGIQGIERYLGTRLSTLDRGGPRALRALWGAAKLAGADRYAEWTVGQLIDVARRGG
jgi:hypothetical protein